MNKHDSLTRETHGPTTHDRRSIRQIWTVCPLRHFCETWLRPESYLILVNVPFIT